MNSGDVFGNLLAKNWDSWVDALEDLPYNELIKKKRLGAGQFLSDIVDEIS